MSGETRDQTFAPEWQYCEECGRLMVVSASGERMSCVECGAVRYTPAARASMPNDSAASRETERGATALTGERDGMACRVCGVTWAPGFGVCPFLPDPASYVEHFVDAVGTPWLHPIYAWAMTEEQRAAHLRNGEGQ